jgi:amino acid adenylation domain-containing protein
MIEFLQKLQANNIRIKLVEGKLKLMSSTKIDTEFMEEIKLKKEDLISFLQQQESGSRFSEKIPQLPFADKYPLSHAQRRLWVLCQFEDSSAAYNIPSALIFHNKVNVILLEKAIKAVIHKYEILRTAFREDSEGEVWQYIQPANEIKFEVTYTDLSEAPDKEKLAESAALTAGMLSFDLKNPPLFNAGILKLEEEKYLFCFTIHHIISDGWSMNIFIKEILNHYKAELEQIFISEAPPALQYRDYAAWHNGLLKSGKMEQHYRFWMNEFSDSVPVINIPSEKLRPAVKTFNGEQVRSVFSKEILERLYDFTTKSGGTLYTVLLSSVYSLLYKYTGQTDMVFATPVAGREHPDLAAQIGLFINTIPIRIKCSEDDSFNNAFNKIKEQSFNCFKHQAYPFDQMVEELKLKRDLSRNALFDMMIVLQNTETEETDGEEAVLRMEEYPVSRNTSQMDINFIFRETRDGLSLLLTYNSDIYSVEMAGQMLAHLKSLFVNLLAFPELPLKKITLPDAEEKKKITVDFNDTKYPYSQTENMVSIFERQVYKTPKNSALTDNRGTVTYEVLNNEANRLAHLLSSFPKSKSSYICVHSNRHRYMIEGVYGILKSGSAYLPVEPYIPESRKIMLLEKLELETVLTDLENIADVLAFSAKLPCLKHVICLNALNDEDLEAYKEQVLPGLNIYSRSSLKELPSANLNRKINPEDLAYVIFTSGSTGVPKGVVVQHKPVINIIEWVNRTFNVNENDKLLFVTSLSFDLSVYDIFGMLATGGSIHIATHEDLKNPEGLVDILFNEKITFWDSAPAALHQLIPFIKAKSKINADKKLRLAFMSGDWVPLRIADDLKSCFPAMEVISLGGATEATIWSNWYKIENIDSNWTSIPYGKPIQNAKYYVLDEFLNPCPVGIPGDLYIGGEVLALRYEADEELTNRKFIASPFNKNERIYLTGDRARYFRDGNLEFLGRLDDQVKVRGYRIELGEIEYVLQNYPGVKRSVLKVIKGNTGQNELVGYVVSDEVLNSKELRSYLQNHLPEYMIPGHFVQIKSVPLTSNGKVDKKNLPDPQESEMDSGVEYVAPSDEAERLIAGIWTELLKKEKVGVTEDFFEAGGHSLLANSLLSKLRKQFSVTLGLRDIFNHTTIRRQALLVNKATLDKYKQIPVTARKSSYPLSSSQQRLWVLSQFAEGNSAYNMAGVFVLEGDLNTEIFEQSFRLLTARHEILRTVFKITAPDEIRQFIIPENEFSFSLTRTDFRNKVSADHGLEKFVQSDINKEFDLSAGPLLRAGLYRQSDNKYVLSYVMHHIISDGWSMGVLINELLAIYNSLLGNKTINLPPLALQYKDYAVWQQEQLNTIAYTNHKEYWLKQLGGEVPVLELAMDNLRPAVKTFSGNIIKKQLDKVLAEKLKVICQQEGSTLFMGLLAVVNVLLYRYTNQEDIIIGSPIAGREHPDLESQIGLYLNTLALRNRFKGEESFLQLLRKVKETCLEAYEHQSYPFDQLVEDLQLQRDMSRSALFDVMVSLQNMEKFKYKQIENVEISEYQDKKNLISKFDLSFDFSESAHALNFVAEYNTDLYNKATIERMLQHFEKLLNEIIQNPFLPLNSFEYISQEETDQLLNKFNTSFVSIKQNRTILDLFSEQVKRTPRNVAVVFEGTTLTYAQLDEQSDHLAGYLNRNYKVLPDDIIGIKLACSEWIVISVLAVLKSGAAYFPIDPELPSQRVEYMVDNSKCDIMITEDELVKFRSEEKNRIDTPLIIVPENLAYVIYTSGSSGLPKGVMVEHAALISKINTEVSLLAADESTCTCLTTNFIFDVSLLEIFVPLVSGGKIFIPSNALKILPEKLVALMAREKVSLLQGTPTYINSISDELINNSEIKNNLKLICIGGESLDQKLVKTLKTGLPFTKINNHYGPTEATIDAIVLQDVNDLTSNIIGKPLSDTRILILDKRQQMVPVGVAGEICIGGSALARGYINNTMLTTEKFIVNPLFSGEFIYRTGDKARWLKDGNIEFLGRLDDQVKIRGYRIELGEIESVLKQYDSINEAVVSTFEDEKKEQYLAAYIISSQPLNVSGILDFLKGKLPVYMIPSSFIQLESIPVTPAGKTDKRSLPHPVKMSFEVSTPYILPRNETENWLVNAWEQVLERDRIGIKDNFFELGGHSLKAIRLLLRINSHFGTSLKMETIFLNSTIEQLAHYISNASQNENYNTRSDIPKAAIMNTYPLSSAQSRIWILSQFKEGSAAYHIPGVYILEGSLNVDILEQSFCDMIDRHEILRTTFEEDDNAEIKQYVKNTKDFPFTIFKDDLLNVKEKEKVVQNTVIAEINHPFDLAKGPLLRVRLLQTEMNRWVLSFVMHHIISDGWSMEIFMRELLTFYKSYSDQTVNPLVPLRIQYKDYAVWQQQQLMQSDPNGHKKFWLDLFSGKLPVLDLDTDMKRSSVKTFNGKMQKRTLNTEAINKLQAYGRSQESTMFMSFLALVNIMLYKYTGKRDLIVGTPVAGREHLDLEDQLGLFINTLALRTQIDHDQNYCDVLQRVKAVAAGAYDHQMYPFDELVSELNIKRDMNRNPLFDIMVSFQNAINVQEQTQLNNIKIRKYKSLESTGSKLDLSIDFAEVDSGLVEMIMEYNTDLYYDETIARIGDYFEQLLKEVTEKPEQKLEALSGPVKAKKPFASSVLQKQNLLNDFEL